MISLFWKFDTLLYNTFRVVSITLLCVLFILMAVNVFLRFVPVYSIGWFDEIVELSFAWLVFVTAATLWRKREHPRISFLESKLEGTRARYVLLVFIEIISIVFLAVFAYFGISLVDNAAAVSPIFQIPRKLFYIVMPVAGVYMTVVSLFFLVRHIIDLQKSSSVEHSSTTELS